MCFNSLHLKVFMLTPDNFVAFVIESRKYSMEDKADIVVYMYNDALATMYLRSDPFKVLNGYSQGPVRDLAKFYFNDTRRRSYCCRRCC